MCKKMNLETKLFKLSNEFPAAFACAKRVVFTNWVTIYNTYQPFHLFCYLKKILSLKVRKTELSWLLLLLNLAIGLGSVSDGDETI